MTFDTLGPDPTDGSGPSPFTPAELAALRATWQLDPSRAFTNHGSFGAMPSPVIDRVLELTQMVAWNPNRFYSVTSRALMADAAERVAEFLNGDEQGLAFVVNATAAASIIAASARFETGDEIIVTNHAYGAVRMGVERYASDAGARCVRVDLPLDPDTPTLIAALEAARTDRTRMLLIDEITSPTARLFDVAAVAQCFAAHGIDVVVDAAHSPGTLPVDLRALTDAGVALWFGNLHKWVCSPPGCGVLYAGPHHRTSTRSLVVSWDEGLGYPAAVRMQGTANLTSFLAAPAAIDFHRGLGYERVRDHGIRLARAGAELVAWTLGVEPVPGPPLPMQLVPLGPADPWEIGAALEAADAPVELALTTFGQTSFVRVGAHLYNTIDDYRVLAAALSDALAHLSAGSQHPERVQSGQPV
jgi:isopenicillin-N epimerase